MPKPKHSLNLFNKRELQSKIQDKIGFKISNKLDCQKLSQLIKNENLPLISESTLYRIFLVDHHKSTPYLHTLNILSQFLNYEDWDSLSQFLNNRSHFKITYGRFNFNHDKKLSKSLISYCIESNNLTPFLKFCEELPSYLSEEEVRLIGKEIYFALLNNPNPDQNINFFKSTSHLPIIREAFFEFMADPKFKIPHYSYGIECYINNIEDNKKIQDFIFAKALLLLNHVYKNDKENALISAEELYVKNTFSEDDLNSIHIYPCIRYLAYQIFYLEMNEKSISNHLEYLFNYIKNKFDLWNHVEKRIVFHTICETFFLCKTNTQIQEKELKELFTDLYDYYPDYFNKSSLQELLIYFNTNSSAAHP